jgi:PAS domain-containing protein
VEISSTIVKDTHGRILTIAQLSDITERKQFELALKVSEEKFKDLFEYIHNGVVIYEAVDGAADFIIRDFNKASESIEKVKRENVIGKKVTECFPGVKDFGLFEVFQRVWRTGKPESYPVTFYADDRISGWRENYVFKLPTGEVVAVYEDLTQQKERRKRNKNPSNFSG